MAFNLKWRLPVQVAEPGKLPAPLRTIYVNLDAGSQGAGTEVSPYNDLPGQTVGDTRVTFGTRVVVKGRMRSTVANFGRLLRGGTPTAPVVYVGNDPSWGQAYLDGSVQLAPAACTSQANAFGNTSWASLRRSVLSNGNNVEDYLHCVYGDTNRDIRYLAGYPQLSNDDAFDFEKYCVPASWVDIIWYPGINESAPVFSLGDSRPRLSLVAANTAMGLAAGTLQAALDTDCAPIVQMRIRPNQWFTFRAGRCDADGTLNAAGAYLTVIDGQRMTEENAAYPDYAMYVFRILNVPRAMDRAGQYTFNPVAGWALDWPYAAETLHRAQGKSGIQIAKPNVWWHGFIMCGMSTSMTVASIAGASGGNSVEVLDTIDSSTVRTQRNWYPAFGSIGAASRQQAFDKCGHAQRYYNTYEYQAIGSGVFFASGSGANIRFNKFNKVNGSNIRGVGDDGRNVLIGGNDIQNCNDLHGNGITLYFAKYNIMVEYNFLKNVGRPITSERNSDYDEQYGEPTCTLRHNTLLASGYGTSAALRLQDSSEIGFTIEDNKMDGGPLGNTAFLCADDMSTSLNGPANRNISVGPALVAPALTLWNAGEGNAQYTRGSAEGAALVAAWAAAGLDPEYAPNGGGHLAGGWDGNG